MAALWSVAGADDDGNDDYVEGTWQWQNNFDVLCEAIREWKKWPKANIMVTCYIVYGELYVCVCLYMCNKITFTQVALQKT